MTLKEFFKNYESRKELNEMMRKEETTHFYLYNGYSGSIWENVKIEELNELVEECQNVSNHLYSILINEEIESDEGHLVINIDDCIIGRLTLTIYIY